MAAQSWLVPQVLLYSWLLRKVKYGQLRLPSGEIRNVDVRCRATVGEVGNAEQSNINWGKAGRNRWKGIRPTVVVWS